MERYLTCFLLRKMGPLRYTIPFMFMISTINMISQEHCIFQIYNPSSSLKEACFNFCQR